MRFTGIITQGASRMGSSEFIKAFKVASSLDGRTFTMYRPEGQSKDVVMIHSFFSFFKVFVFIKHFWSDAVAKKMCVYVCVYIYFLF